MNPRKRRVSWPAPPSAGATIVLAATHPGSPGGVTVAPGSSVIPDHVQPSDADAVEFVWHKNDQASAANGLRLYITDDGGLTWHESDCKDDSNAATIGSAAPVQVPVLSAGQEWRETIRVSQYTGWAVLYTAGATGPTAVTGWRGTTTLHIGAASVQQ